MDKMTVSYVAQLTGAAQPLSDEQIDELARGISWGLQGARRWERLFARAVEAAVRAQPAAEPVAHQYLFHSPFGGEVWRNDAREWNGCKPHGHRALYTHPAQPAAEQDAKAFAVSVFDDVLGDIADWEDKALAEACIEAKRRLCAVPRAQPAAEPAPKEPFNEAACRAACNICPENQWDNWPCAKACALATEPQHSLAEQMAELMRGLEIPPGVGACSASALYALGAAIADQAKAGAKAEWAQPAPERRRHPENVGHNPATCPDCIKDAAQAARAQPAAEPLSDAQILPHGRRLGLVDADTIALARAIEAAHGIGAMKAKP